MIHSLGIKISPMTSPRNQRTGRSCSLGYLGAREGKYVPPEKIGLRPGEEYPWKRQYPLKLEALRGLQLLLSKFLNSDSLCPANPLQHPHLPIQTPSRGNSLCKTYKQWEWSSHPYSPIGDKSIPPPHPSAKQHLVFLCFGSQWCIFLYCPISRLSIRFCLWMEGPWHCGG